MTKQPDIKGSQQGFTLVELAMVIVVIGLLVGGITAFRNYARNAELMTTMNQAKFYIDAFNKFQTKYNAPPGDYATASSAWTGAGNGDGNGVIRANSGAGNAAEYYYTFQHLALAGLIPGTYTGAANGSSGATIGVNVPGGAVANSAYLFDHPKEADGAVSGGAGGGDALYFDGMYPNLLRIAGVNGTSYNSIPKVTILTGKQAYQLDNKFDDGQPGTGNIVAPINTALTSCATTNVPTTAVYSTTANDGPACYIFLKIQ